MAETFPIKCGGCTEIVDVAADMDPAAAYNCPMCGAASVIAEAEDFDLPCPAEVVIEEQTAERLRFRLRSSLRGSNGQVLRLLLSFVLPIHVFFWGVCIVSVRNWHPATVFERFILGTLSAFMSFLFSSIFLFSKTSIELSDGQLMNGKRLWFFKTQRRLRIDAVKCVTTVRTRSDLWPFRDDVHYAYVRAKPWFGRFAESPNPDIARYITHLIRRQLTTMGHELQDG